MADDKKDELKVKLQKQWNELRRIGVDTDEEYVKNQEDILTLTAQQLQYQIKRNNELLKYKRDAKELVGITKQIRDNEYELIDITAKLQRGIKGNREELVGIGDTTADLVKAQLKLLAHQKRTGKITAQQYEDRGRELLKLRQIAQAQETIARQGDAFANVYSQALNEAENMASTIEAQFSQIPGGGLLFQYLGGDKLALQLKTAVSAGFGNMAKAMKAGLGPLQALRAGMAAFNATVMANPVLLIVAAIGLALIAIKKLVDFAADFEKESRETAKNMGVTVAQATQLRKEAMATSTEFGTQLARTEDIVAVQQESAKAFGTTAMMSADTARNIADIGKSFGYGAEQAAKVNTAFETMGASSDQAVTMQRELAAESLKAGVNVGAVTADIAENAKSTAKYFGGNVKAMAKAAVEAAKMGVSLSTMSKVADKLLDIEGSLTAQFEFQALSGRQMNLDKARQLALEGDIAGATKEVMSNVGGIAEFNKMSMLERKKLAEATGMEVDELQKSLTIQEKLGDLTDEQKAAMAGLNLSAAELNDLSAEELQTKLAQQQAADKSAKAFDDLKTELASALLPLGEALMQVFSLLSPIVKILGKTLKIAFTPLKAITKAISGIVDAFYGVYDAISMIFSGDITGGFKKLGKTIITSMLAPLQIVWDVLSGVASTFGFDIGADLGGMASSALGLTPVGDLSMPSSGPIVSSPREGAIYQGTANDDVAMGPGVANGSGGNSAVASALAKQNALLQQIASALQNPPPIQIGQKVISELSSVLDVERSYRN